MIMVNPNELFTNMFRNFSFMNNPFLEALKTGMPQTTAGTPGVPANTINTSEFAETFRQHLQDQVKLMNSITSCALASTGMASSTANANEAVRMFPSMKRTILSCLRTQASRYF